MITITHSKIQGFKPIWAPFHGFSLLFDNPGDSLSSLNSMNILQKMDCKPLDPELHFYTCIWEHSRSELEQMLISYLFCPLPFHSYHVTVWDGINQNNVHHVRSELREEADSVLHSLPSSMLQASPMLSLARHHPIRIEMNKSMVFMFDRLEKWSNSCLVARIKPADEESRHALANLEKLRNELTELYQERYGLVTTTPNYRPHISLGYFCNKEAAEQSSMTIDRLNAVLQHRMSGLRLPFPSISLYGMTDMETFFKVP